MPEGFVIDRKEIEVIYNMSSATYFFPPLFSNFFALLVNLMNIRGADNSVFMMLKLKNKMF